MLNQNSFAKGDKVLIETRKEGTVKGYVSHLTKSGLVYVHGDNGKSYERVPEKVIKIANASTNIQVTEAVMQENQPLLSQRTFDINERFSFLESLVRMTIKGKRVSLVITGEGGLGKTYSVKKGIEQMGLSEHGEYYIIKGFSTAKGLYRTLFENNGKLIVFDDCDEVLKNDIAKNILKGALDSYDTRIVNWITNKEDDALPSSFEFTGRIIFISNMSKYKIDQAIMSRASNVDLTMSIEDKLERMQHIISSKGFKSAVPQEDKQKAMDFIRKHAFSCNNLTLRTLIEVLDYITSGEKNWEGLAEYVVYNS